MPGGHQGHSHVPGPVELQPEERQHRDGHEQHQLTHCNGQRHGDSRADDNPGGHGCQSKTAKQFLLPPGDQRLGGAEYRAHRDPIGDHPRRDVLDRLERLVLDLLSLQGVGRRDSGDRDVRLIDKGGEDSLHQSGGRRIGRGEIQQQRVALLLQDCTGITLLHLLERCLERACPARCSPRDPGSPGRRGAWCRQKVRARPESPAAWLIRCCRRSDPNIRMKNSGNSTLKKTLNLSR